MKNKVLNAILGLSASLFTFIATATSVSACGAVHYQPKEPKCLREE